MSELQRATESKQIFLKLKQKSNQIKKIQKKSIKKYLPIQTILLFSVVRFCFVVLPTTCLRHRATRQSYCRRPKRCFRASFVRREQLQTVVLQRRFVERAPVRHRKVEERCDARASKCLLESRLEKQSFHSQNKLKHVDHYTIQ